MKQLSLLFALLLAACSAAPSPTLALEPQAVGMFTTTINSGRDDAAENRDRWVSPQFTTIPLSQYKAGFRFDVSLPDGATVTDARLQFKAAAKSSGTARMTVRAQSDAPAFTASSNTISTRVLTDSSVSWSVPTWRAVGHRNSDQRTPNLAAPLNEALDEGSGTSVAFVISGTGVRTAYAYDSGKGPATLTVTYSTAETPPVEPDPVEPTQDPSVSTSADFTASQLRGATGVNIHETYDDTAYHDPARITTYLRDLEVSWIRSTLQRNPRSWHVAWLRDVKAAGIKVTMNVGEPISKYGNFDNGDSAEAINQLRTTYSGTFDAFEMPNEWDLFSPDRSGWVSQLNRFYDEYYPAMKRAFPDLLYYGPSFGTSSGRYDFTRRADAANIHPYSGALMQEQPDIAAQITEAKNQSPRVVATEWGFHNATNCSGWCQPGITEELAPHYLVRGLVYQYSRGVMASYIYQLFDQKPCDASRTEQEEWFGLVAVEGTCGASPSTWTLRKKPAFYAVDRFQTYLRDAGTVAAPGTLPFEVSGLPSDAAVAAIARKDGSYDVALWLKRSLWNRDTKTALADNSVTGTLRFASPSTVDAYRPSVSDDVLRVGTGVSELSVRVDGKVTFFRVKP